MEGSSVTLTCSSDANPAAKYTWYKRSGDKQVQPLSEETQFVVSSIRSSDSGEYGSFDFCPININSQIISSVGPEPSGVPPDTGAERNKGLLNFGRENILLQAQESPPGGGKMFWECLGTPADFQAQPTQKREIHSAEEHELQIPEEEGRRSSRRGSTRKSAACPVQRPKTA
ncbi:unnamed protein product [Pleuronectes platessa]|uniref:Ig-like domain-containing protein n=1 Tax=Pleuronectes platessa TaxID=8262 RepID=A0A9N7YJ69_PLEPL|nr:unnamed protein product [Pleuronectes platessa]